MSKKALMQFRYSSEDSSTGFNQPKDKPNGTNSLLDGYLTGKIFEGYYPIVQLGIQAPAETQFYLNKGINPIKIGTNGIYQLDLKDNIEINSIEFDYKSLTKIRDDNSQFLLVDIIYEIDEADDI